MSALTQERIRRAVQGRFNPIRGLTPEILSRALDNFEAGHLAEAAVLWARIESRDDTLMSVIPKRRKAVARHGHEVLTLADLPEGKKAEAERHRAALQYFYDHLTATSALDENQRGGARQLFRLMMDAQAKGYAVFEIVWEKQPGGYAAELRFVPLQFFENTLGRLRFLPHDGASEGVDLKPGEWLVCAGDGLMRACSICYMFKKLPLQDWIIYCQDHGKPALHGKTAAARESEEWRQMEEALEAFSSQLRLVTGQEEAIEAIDVSVRGELPYPKLIEKMDRAMMALWRGGDLSTMSQGGESSGASQQQDERDLLEQDDAEWISECLNTGLDRFVIENTFGRGVETLAYVRISAGNTQDTRLDLEVDQALAGLGVPLGVDATRERYGRPKPDEGEPLLQRAAPQAPLGFPRAPLANEGGLRAAGRRELARALAADLAPLRERLARILAIADPEIRRARMRGLLEEIQGGLAGDILADPAAAQAIERLASAALFNGLEKAPQ